MFNTVTRLLALAVALAAAGTPAVALASQGQSVQTYYNVSFTELYGSPIPYTGELRLTVSPDGIVNGYYIPVDQISFITVTGGRQGNAFWFDIGNRHPIHVTATLEHGNLVGSAIAEGSTTEYTFRAVRTTAAGAAAAMG